MNINEIIDMMKTKKINEYSFKYPINGIINEVLIVLSNNDNDIPYLLVFPETIEDNYILALETINLESNKENELINDGLYRGFNLSNLLSDFKSPVIIPIIPSVEGGVPYYQQLSKECFQKSAKYQRIDQQVVKIIEASKKYIFNKTKIQGEEKIFINGYSSSGVFAQRFCLLHPELVDMACIGGASGSIPLPIKNLGYPLGLSGYRELTGKDFNLDAYQQIKFRYYVGELDALEKSSKRYTEMMELAPMHDMSYMERSVPSSVGQQFRKYFGQEMIERSINQEQFLTNMGIDITQKIILGRSHSNNLGHGVNELGDNFIKEAYQELINFRKVVPRK